MRRTMAIKPGAKTVQLLEQIIEDPVTGLTIKLEAWDGGDYAMHLYGNLPLGNRTLVFDKEGEFVGAGTHLSECPRPTWIKDA